MLENLKRIQQDKVQELLDAGAIDRVTIASTDGAYMIVVFHGENASVITTDDDNIVAFDDYKAACACLASLRLTELGTIETDTVDTERPMTEHEQWMFDELEEAIAEADDPNTRWISSEEAKAISEEQQATWIKRAQGLT